MIEKNIIGEAIVIKVRKLRLDSFNIKMFIDTEYGIIQIKFKSAYVGVNRREWGISLGTKHNFDTLLILCADENMRNIERVYVIPEVELYGRQRIFIAQKGKWEKFRIDEGAYNDAYHDLISYIKDKNKNIEEIFVEDIKKWLERE